MSALTHHQAVPLEVPTYSFDATPSQAAAGIQERRFNPYTDNGGSILGIAGDNFCILAGDTRLTSGYNIQTRYHPKVYRIGASDDAEAPDASPEHPTSTDPSSATASTASNQSKSTSRHYRATPQSSNIVLAVVGYSADGMALAEKLNDIVRIYAYQHQRPMSIKACAQRLSTLLYSKRFFPYYTHAILGGLDENGKGALYSYDPVGSYEREQCRAGGAASSLIMPFLDNQVNFKNQYVPGSGVGLELKSREAKPLEREETESLVRDAFTSAVERHIEVGDGLQMCVVTDKGVEEIYVELKKD